MELAFSTVNFFEVGGPRGRSSLCQSMFTSIPSFFIIFLVFFRTLIGSLKSCNTMLKNTTSIQLLQKIVSSAMPVTRVAVSDASFNLCFSIVIVSGFLSTA